MDLAAAIAKIEAHLAQHPDDGRGYEVLAPVYLRIGRANDAVRAASEALRLLGRDRWNGTRFTGKLLFPPPMAL